MAKIVKDTREVINVDEELNKIKSNQKQSNSTKEKNVNTKSTKKDNKKKTTKKNKKDLGIIRFFKEVKNEVSKVKWPSKKDMVKYSVATIVFILFFAIFFYLIDLIIALLKAGV